MFLDSFVIGKPRLLPLLPLLGFSLDFPILSEFERTFATLGLTVVTVVTVVANSRLEFPPPARTPPADSFLLAAISSSGQ